MIAPELQGILDYVHSSELACMEAIEATRELDSVTVDMFSEFATETSRAFGRIESVLIELFARITELGE